MSEVRHAAVAGKFYPAEPDTLRALVHDLLAAAGPPSPQPARAAIVPHAGLVYSGACAARVFTRIHLPDVVVLLAPNHAGRRGHRGGASAWSGGAFETPLGRVEVAAEFLSELEARCPLVAHDPVAHASEHAVEVELPFLTMLAPQARVAALLLAWDDWEACRTLATALARLIARWKEPVLLLASSDMTHFTSADEARRRDHLALNAVRRLDARGLLDTCRREHVTMCGRAPAATAIEAARQLGATVADVVDYRHSGMVSGDDTHVVAYAGVVIT